MVCEFSIVVFLLDSAASEIVLNYLDQTNIAGSTGVCFWLIENIVKRLHMPLGYYCKTPSCVRLSDIL